MTIKFNEFEALVRHRWMYEAIYDDSEDRRILVICLLDAFSAMRHAIAAEREACEEICVANGALGLAAAIRARGQV